MSIKTKARRSVQPYIDINMEDLPCMKEPVLLSFINNTSLKEPYLSYREVRLLLESFEVEVEDIFKDSEVVAIRGNMMTGQLEILGSQQRVISLERNRNMIIAFIELLSKKEKTTFFLSYNDLLLEVTRRDPVC